MGVQGLWHLLQPCARPTKLESLEGKRLAIDSSIWLYHFQMAMRDKEGRTLSNAHILGFLWRILKLIHFGVRPIFVFDGGAPVLKRKTLAGRKTRKTGARDDHRKVAERLLHARMREAALAHVSASGPSGAREEIEEGEHGLGSNVVYMDDLAGSTGASAAVENLNSAVGADAIDDGSINTSNSHEKDKDTEEARKKKRDQWHKDPYALPALERDMATVTAENSAASRNARGGGKRPDIRFATEGELRSLLSSIQPTDMDLDSDFFRSLPTELQYELVGDLRAASRGTSYKRLQAMLASSPTPIDFSRAQIAGLKTRNELTQKVLEVTDEIGDAHIKVPIRVAGARNREYVLIKNKGDQAGFILGVRDVGTTQEKAISVDGDSASATTAEDDYERRNTDEEIDLEDVSIDEDVASQPKMINDIPQEILQANPNDPMARKNVARELLQRRARELAKEKAKEKGIVDDRELMEEELSKMQAGSSSRKTSGKRNGNGLFRQDEFDLERIGAESSDDNSNFSASPGGIEEDLLDIDEAEDLARALHESTEDARNSEGEDEELELDDVDTHGVAANDYSSFYKDVLKNAGNKSSIAENPDRMSQSPAKGKDRLKSISAQPLSPPKEESSTGRATKTRGGLGFRMYDKEGYPERLDPKLLTKMRWDEDENHTEEEEKVDTRPDHKSPKAAQTAISISDDSEHGDFDNFEANSPKLGPKADTITEKKTGEKEDEDGNTLKVVEYVDKPNDAVTEKMRGDQSFEKHDASQQKRSPNLSQVDQEAGKLPSRSLPPPVEQVQEQFSPQEVPSTVESIPTAKSDTAPEVVSIPIDSPSQASQVGTSKTDSPLLSEAELPPREASPSDSPERGLQHQQEAGGDRDPIEIDEISLDNANTTSNTQDDVEFDNLVSMAEEEGDLPDVIAKDIMQPDTYLSDGQVSPQPQYSPDWSSRSTSPEAEEEVVLGPDGFPLPTAEELEAMEAQDEADLEHMEGDQDEFISFLSRAKGRGFHEVRQEVQDEVNKLRSEHAATRRNEGDVTIQMAKEIQLMLRLFGLPYITAPMEAEAQCAELVSIGLADGIITDDSDVFLFGGTFIYKNMFNNKKFVECYKLSDLQHDLGMDRTKLVQLAYLLGSDYTDGLEGVGPVLAMEILSNFIGDDGLVQFRDWWLKVQTGQDTPRDTCNTTLKRIKRTLRNKVHLNDNWPDENVLNAYYEPVVDSSEEAFQWGLPDLDSLRSFFNEYLRWDREKTDHYLIPAIEEQNRRSRRTQGTLDGGNFFDLGNGSSGIYAGRQKPAYGSSRLQQVITNFRESKKASDKRNSRRGGQDDPVALSDEDNDDEENGTLHGVSEGMVGKEMGKRSRPIVRKDAVEAESNGEEEEEEAQELAPKKATRGKGSRGGRGGKAPITEAGIRKRKASQANKKNTKKGGDIEQIEDEEWRPRTAVKRTRKSGPSEGAPGKTSLSQARNMSLDEISSLPPSRAKPDMRPRMSASSSREELFRRSARQSSESSGLSDI